MAIKVDFVNESSLVELRSLYSGDTFLYGQYLHIYLNLCVEDEVFCLRIDSVTGNISRQELSVHALVEPVDITIKVEQK